MSNQPNDTCVVWPGEDSQKLTEENFLKLSSSRIKRVKEAQEAITLTMQSELLAKVDVAADSLCISRAVIAEGS